MDCGPWAVGCGNKDGRGRVVQKSLGGGKKKGWEVEKTEGDGVT